MKRVSPLKAIRLKCLDCMAGQVNEIKVCSVLDCPLWLFRLGKHPFSEKNRKNPFIQRGFFEKNANLSRAELLKLICDERLKKKVL